MSKIIAIAIVSALTLFPNFGNPNTAPSMPQDPEMEVMVLFSGLMVFHQREDKSYEVGILNQELSEGHEFCVQRQGGPRVCRKTAEEMKNSPHKETPNDPKWLPTGTKWRILVIGTQPNHSALNAAQKKQRRPDVPNQQFDFGWIIDLDGDDFHKGELELAEKKLTPIIQLPNVALFTKYKSPDFVRWQGEKPKHPEKAKPFGFVSETIAFRIKLKKGEELILQEEDDPSKTRIITSVPYVTPHDIGGNYEVLTISNTRYPQHETSDFRMYYKLFPKVKESEQFDFAENETEPCEPPRPHPDEKKPCLALNPAPKRKLKDESKDKKPKDDQPIKDTCCGLVCTQIRLVNRKEPLK